VLVYLPFDHPDEVQTLLAPFTTHHFFIYGIAELSFPVDKGRTCVLIRVAAFCRTWRAATA
jgi:hypothetical protein